MKHLLGSSSWRCLQTAKLAWLLGLLYRCVHCGWGEHETKQSSLVTTHYSSSQYAKLTSPQVSLQLNSKSIRPVSKRSWVGLSRNSHGRDNLNNVTSITASRNAFYGWVQGANGEFSEIIKKSITIVYGTYSGIFEKKFPENFSSTRFCYKLPEFRALRFHRMRYNTTRTIKIE